MVTALVLGTPSSTTNLSDIDMLGTTAQAACGGLMRLLGKICLPPVLLAALVHVKEGALCALASRLCCMLLSLRLHQRVHVFGCGRYCAIVAVAVAQRAGSRRIPQSCTFGACRLLAHACGNASGLSQRCLHNNTRLRPVQ